MLSDAFLAVYQERGYVGFLSHLPLWNSRDPVNAWPLFVCFRVCVFARVRVLYRGDCQSVPHTRLCTCARVSV
jgi:hypothetical protein